MQEGSSPEVPLEVKKAVNNWRDNPTTENMRKTDPTGQPLSTGDPQPGGIRPARAQEEAQPLSYSVAEDDDPGEPECKVCEGPCQVPGPKPDADPMDVFFEAKMRQFESGANRNVDDDQLDYEGFLSPLVLKRFAEYMHEHRFTADGSTRASDNWQNGIPLESYAASEWRHHMDFWLHHRNHGDLAREGLEQALCGMMFNIMGYLHEVLIGDFE